MCSTDIAESRASRPALEHVEVVSNERVAEGVGLMALQAPKTAATVRPGQFVHLRLAEDSSRILRRPFSVHRVRGGRIEILYQVLGHGTRRMSMMQPGYETDLIGPLGHGWEIPEGTAHALIVAGGLGAAPLGMLAEGLAASGIALVVVHGAPCSERLVGREVFEDAARRVEVCTDDGSEGEPGFATVASGRVLALGGFDIVYTCGPEPMQRAVAEQARAAGVACQVSLERYMACGIGSCLSCVVETTRGMRRACVDGPVFEAGEVWPG